MLRAGRLFGRGVLMDVGAVGGMRGATMRGIDTFRLFGSGRQPIGRPEDAGLGDAVEGWKEVGSAEENSVVSAIVGAEDVEEVLSVTSGLPPSWQTARVLEAAVSRVLEAAKAGVAADDVAVLLAQAGGGGDGAVWEALASDVRYSELLEAVEASLRRDVSRWSSGGLAKLVSIRELGDLVIPEICRRVEGGVLGNAEVLGQLVGSGRPELVKVVGKLDSGRAWGLGETRRAEAAVGAAAAQVEGVSKELVESLLRDGEWNSGACATAAVWAAGVSGVRVDASLLKTSAGLGEDAIWGVARLLERFPEEDEYWRVGMKVLEDMDFTDPTKVELVSGLLVTAPADKRMQVAQLMFASNVALDKIEPNALETLANVGLSDPAIEQEAAHRLRRKAGSNGRKLGHRQGARVAEALQSDLCASLVASRTARDFAGNWEAAAQVLTSSRVVRCGAEALRRTCTVETAELPAEVVAVADRLGGFDAQWDDEVIAYLIRNRESLSPSEIGAAARIFGSRPKAQELISMAFQSLSTPENNSALGLVRDAMSAAFTAKDIVDFGPLESMLHTLKTGLELAKFVYQQPRDESLDSQWTEAALASAQVSNRLQEWTALGQDSIQDMVASAASRHGVAIGDVSGALAATATEAAGAADAVVIAAARGPWKESDQAKQVLELCSAWHAVTPSAKSPALLLGAYASIGRTATHSTKAIQNTAQLASQTLSSLPNLRPLASAAFALTKDPDLARAGHHLSTAITSHILQSSTSLAPTLSILRILQPSLSPEQESLLVETCTTTEEEFEPSSLLDAVVILSRSTKSPLPKPHQDLLQNLLLDLATPPIFQSLDLQDQIDLLRSATKPALLTLGIPLESHETKPTIHHLDASSRGPPPAVVLAATGALHAINNKELKLLDIVASEMFAAFDEFFGTDPISHESVMSAFSYQGGIDTHNEDEDDASPQNSSLDHPFESDDEEALQAKALAEDAWERMDEEERAVWREMAGTANMDPIALLQRLEYFGEKDDEESLEDGEEDEDDILGEELAGLLLAARGVPFPAVWALGTRSALVDVIESGLVSMVTDAEALEDAGLVDILDGWWKMVGEKVKEDGYCRQTLEQEIERRAALPADLGDAGSILRVATLAANADEEQAEGLAIWGEEVVEHAISESTNFLDVVLLAAQCREWVGELYGEEEGVDGEEVRVKVRQALGRTIARLMGLVASSLENDVDTPDEVLASTARACALPPQKTLNGTLPHPMARSWPLSAQSALARPSTGVLLSVARLVEHRASIAAPPVVAEMGALDREAAVQAAQTAAQRGFGGKTEKPDTDIEQRAASLLVFRSQSGHSVVPGLVAAFVDGAETASELVDVFATLDLDELDSDNKQLVRTAYATRPEPQSDDDTLLFTATAERLTDVAVQLLPALVLHLEDEASEVLAGGSIQGMPRHSVGRVPPKDVITACTAIPRLQHLMDRYVDLESVDDVFARHGPESLPARALLLTSSLLSLHLQHLARNPVFEHPDDTAKQAHGRALHQAGIDPSDLALAFLSLKHTAMSLPPSQNDTKTTLLAASSDSSEALVALDAFLHPNGRTETKSSN